MSLTLEERRNVFKVLDKTSPNNGAAPALPQSILDLVEISDKEDISLYEDNHEFKVTVHHAKHKKTHCPVHINIHGGGFVGPHAENDTVYCSYLADLIEGIVVDVDYTLSDSAPWPVAFNQCYSVVPYVLQHCRAWKADPDRVSVGGYSAGATYAASVALKSVMTDDFKLALEVLGYPLLDFAIPSKYKVEGFNAPPASIARGEAFNALLFDGEAASVGADPLISPLYADEALLAKLPRTLICTASKCGFRFEDEEYGIKLASLGVEVTLKRFPDTRHGFIPHFYEGWEEAIRLISHTISVA